jgi:hypothetical protein
MAGVSIENLRGLPDIQTLYQWNAFITKAPAGAPIPPNFNFQVTTSSMPTASNELIEVSVRGHKINQPGVQTYGATLDLACVETVDLPFIKFIQGWREGQWETGSGVQKLRVDSEAQIMLQLLNRQHGANRTFTLIGCFLQDYQLGELGTDSAAMLPTLTIKYDYFKEG